MSPLLIKALPLVAEFVPDVIGWFAGDKAEDAARDVVGIAESITGKKGEDALDAIATDPNVALEFKRAVMADKHRKDEMALDNTKDARLMYQSSNKMADTVAQRIIDWNLPIGFFLLVLNAAFTYYMSEHAALIAGISTLIGAVVHALLKERQDVINFFFGSSMGSKMKSLFKGS